jgi:hypothetical protein
VARLHLLAQTLTPGCILDKHTVDEARKLGWDLADHYGCMIDDRGNLLPDSDGAMAGMLLQAKFLLDKIQQGSSGDRGLKAELSDKADVLKSLQSDREPVGPTASLILEKLRELPEHRGMDTEALLNWLAEKPRKIIIDAGTLRKHLKQLGPYGLKNKRKLGYYVR